MDPTPQPALTPAQLVFLRRLVTVLTITMIAGMLLITALFVIRFSGDRVPTAAQMALPSAITLPDGTLVTAFTQAPSWYAVVTAGDEILIFDRATGALRQILVIKPPM